MLDLAETSIVRGGWTFRRLDGTMTQQRRESALEVSKYLPGMCILESIYIYIYTYFLPSRLILGVSSTP